MTAKNFGLNRTRKLHIKKETTFGTPVMPAAGDAIKFRTFTIDFKRARENRADVRASRSMIERITGKNTVSWTLEAYLNPSGVNSQAPDIGGDATNVGLLQGVFSSYTATEEGIYQLQAGQAALPFFTMFHQTEDLFGETLVSAWVESMKISGNSGDPPMMSFEGGASEYAMSQASQAGAAGTATKTLLLSTNASFPDHDSFDKHAFIRVGAAGPNRRVTARTGRTLTIDAVTSWGATAVIGPAVIAETTAGSPISGVAGSFTIDAAGGANPPSTVINVMSYEINVKNNMAVMDDEAFQANVTDFVPGFREVTGSFKVKMRKDWVFLLGTRNNFRAHDVAIVLGDTTNSKLTIDMDQIECEFEGVDWQSDREAVMNFNFTALATSAGENEIKLSFS